MIVKSTEKNDETSYLESFLLWTWNEMKDSLKETKTPITNRKEITYRMATRVLISTSLLALSVVVLIIKTIDSIVDFDFRLIDLKIFTIIFLPNSFFTNYE